MANSIIRWTVEQINANPNFTIAMADLMPLVVEIDSLFEKYVESDAEKAGIIERLRAQAEAIEKAEQRLSVADVEVGDAFDACLQAQATLREAREIGDPVPLADANTAAQVAQAAYELASVEYTDAEKAYTDLLNAAKPSQDFVYSLSMLPTGDPNELKPEEPTMDNVNVSSSEPYQSDEDSEVGAVVAGSVE